MILVLEVIVIEDGVLDIEYLEDEVEYLVLDNIEDVVLEVEGRGPRSRRRGRRFLVFISFM